jgi:hypothetical protein
MKIFVAAGIPRSGSTWLYNAMRLILREKYAILYSAWIDDRDAAAEANADASLIKIHAINADLADQASVIMTCHRDPRDIAVSLQAMGWFRNRTNALARMQEFRAYHEFWSPRSAIDLSYAQIVNDDEASLRRIAQALDVNFTDDKLASLAATLRNTPNNRDPDAKHDPEFLTHANHRNDGRDGRWKDQLDPKVARAIETQHRDWIRRLGYACD